MIKKIDIVPRRQWSTPVFGPLVVGAALEDKQGSIRIKTGGNSYVRFMEGQAELFVGKAGDWPSSKEMMAVDVNISVEVL